MTLKHGNKAANQTLFPFSLPELPYSDSALEPHMSADTFSYHHKKHHASYVTNLNKLVEGTDLEGKTLEEIIDLTCKDSSKVGVFNNAAQIWNHSFFWHSMKAGGGGLPDGELAKAIERDFGSYAKFKEEFKLAATTQFGSGWAWLVADGDNKLKIIKTSNASTPITDGYTALINCDVWEHAYYVDYQNRRPDYVETFLDKLINWDFANSNF